MTRITKISILKESDCTSIFNISIEDYDNKCIQEIVNIKDDEKKIKEIIKFLSEVINGTKIL